jgi:hypothetical protein
VARITSVSTELVWFFSIIIYSLLLINSVFNQSQLLFFFNAQVVLSLRTFKLCSLALTL